MLPLTRIRLLPSRHGLCRRIDYQDLCQEICGCLTTCSPHVRDIGAGVGPFRTYPKIKNDLPNYGLFFYRIDMGTMSKLRQSRRAGRVQAFHSHGGHAICNRFTRRKKPPYNSVRHSLCTDGFRSLLPLREKVRMRGHFAAISAELFDTLTLTLSRRGRGNKKATLRRAEICAEQYWPPYKIILFLVSSLPDSSQEPSVLL